MADEPREFDCVDCGVHVFSWNFSAANEQDVCAECSFVCGVEDPAVREKMRAWFRSQQHWDQ